MAISGSTQWEVRNGGSDTNGGGFVAGASGVDYSQQTAPQYSVADGVANGTTTITSATANFGTDVVGNIMYVQGGTGSIAAGWYQVVSRTNSTTIVVDRSTGLTAGTGVTLKIGGALASPGMGAYLMTTGGGGNVLWIKYSASPYLCTTTTLGSGSTLAFPNTTTSKYVIGYDTNRSVNNLDANRPTLKASGIASVSMISFGSSSQENVFRRLILDGDNLTGITGMTVPSTRYAIDGMKALNCVNGFSGSQFCDCWAVNCSSNGFAGSTGVYGCLADGCAVGFSLSGAPSLLARCIAKNGGVGFSAGAFAASIAECTAVGNSSHGVQSTGTNTNIMNVLSYGNGGNGFNITSRTILRACAAGNNTLGSTNSTQIEVPSLVVLTADPFVDSANGNYALNNVAGGGALLRNAGFPDTYAAGLTPTYIDIGAAQHGERPQRAINRFVTGGVF